LRITIILGPFYPVPTVLGGAVEKVQLQLAAAYARAGRSVTMISRRYGDFPHEEIVDGVRHIRIPSSDRGALLLTNLALDLPYAIRAARAMPESDITVTNSFFLPMVLPRRKAGRIYVHAARYPKQQFFLYGRADRLQAISNAVADAIAEQAPRLAPKVKVIGYPIPERNFASPSREPAGRTVLYVGRIAREKGVHLLIRAFSMLGQSGDWKLRIVGPHAVAQGGDGEAYLQELKDIAAPLGGACEFAGPVFNEAALLQEYRSAQIFVYSSLAETGEAFGLAPLEAMASGCAVIVSNLPCFDDFIRDQRNGLKFDHRSADAERGLAANLQRLMDNPALMREIALAGYETAREFREDVIAEKMLADFESLLSSGPPH
jgi:glycosyltransferase involved in cell wall biosynthesis